MHEGGAVCLRCAGAAKFLVYVDALKCIYICIRHRFFEVALQKTLRKMKSCTGSVTMTAKSCKAVQEHCLVWIFLYWPTYGMWLYL